MEKTDECGEFEHEDKIQASLRKRCHLANGRRRGQDHGSLPSTTWWKLIVNCYSPSRTWFVRLPADGHTWWNSNEQESCVTHRSHLLESPFDLRFSELRPWAYARTWTTAGLSRNTNLLLKQHTSYQNVTGMTSSKCPSKAVHSGTKIAKCKTTKANKSTHLSGEKYCHERLGVWVAPSAYCSYSCSQWIIHHQPPVEMVWSPQ